MFYTLLYQNGGQGYLPDGSRTDLDGQPALDAFTQWTKFFTDYGLPLYYNLIFDTCSRDDDRPPLEPQG